VPKAILDDMEIITVESMDEVLSKALICQEPDKVFCRNDVNAVPLTDSLLREELRVERRH